MPSIQTANDDGFDRARQPSASHALFWLFPQLQGFQDEDRSFTKMAGDN
jgi:hypothetical protein